MDVNKHEWLSYFTPRNKQSTRKALLLLFLIAQSQLGLQWMLWAYNWYIKRNAKPFHMYSETTHVQWNHTCTVKPHMYSETTHVQWNHTCTVKSHMYSETTHVQWNHTCTVKSHMYSEATHVQWNHTYMVFFILWSIADYQFKLPFEATNQMVNDYHENGYLIIRLVFLILVFTANHHY
jgi:hypothetical protein